MPQPLVLLDRAYERAASEAGAAPPRVLIVIAGILRTFELTWPRMRRALLEPNHATHSFDVVISTGLERCSGKDIYSGCCALTPQMEEPRTSLAELTQKVERLCAPHLRGLQVAHAMSTAQRLRLVLARWSLREYVHVLVTRPDVIFFDPSTRHGPWSLAPVSTSQLAKAEGSAGASSWGRGRDIINLSKLCDRGRPDLAIIYANFLHANPHGDTTDRDFDYAQLACKPSALLPFYFHVRRPGQASCNASTGDVCDDMSSFSCAREYAACAGKGPQEYVAVRAGGPRLIGISRTKCTGFFCSVVAQFERTSLSLGTVEPLVAAKIHTPCTQRVPTKTMCAGYPERYRPTRQCERDDQMQSLMRQGATSEIVCTQFEMRMRKPARVGAKTARPYVWMKPCDGDRLAPSTQDGVRSSCGNADALVIRAPDHLVIPQDRCSERFTSSSEAIAACKKTDWCGGVAQDNGIGCLGPERQQGNWTRLGIDAFSGKLGKVCAGMSARVQQPRAQIHASSGAAHSHTQSQRHGGWLGGPRSGAGVARWPAGSSVRSAPNKL
jgi:hypothetical protein